MNPIEQEIKNLTADIEHIKKSVPANGDMADSIIRLVTTMEEVMVRRLITAMQAVEQRIAEVEKKLPND